MAEPSDLVLTILREMRLEIRDRFEEVDRRFNTVDKRLEDIEGAQKSYRQALSADSMMSKLVTGDFEEPILALEAKVDALVKARQ